MIVANAVAYYDTATITTVQGFIVQAKVVNVKKLFFSSMINMPSVIFVSKAGSLPDLNTFGQAFLKILDLPVKNCHSQTL